MSRKYFLTYYDYLESWSELSDAECGRLLRAALKYGSTGKIPELSGNERFLFGTLKMQIDRDNENYEKKCVALKANGKLGGRPKPEKPNGFFENQNKPNGFS